MKKKKVVFVEPRASINVFEKYMNLPLLGPIYLATIAKKAGYDVSVINENIVGREINEEELGSADYLGVSCITTTVNRGKEIANQYKRIRKADNLESWAVIGGFHASALPYDVKNHFDQVVVGEGERVILDILSGKNKDKIIYGGNIMQLDDLPAPDFTLVKGWQNNNRAPVETSRGCPFDCNFCSVTGMFGRKYRFKSKENVVKDIENIETYPNKIKHEFFVDDNFAANPKRLNELLDSMIENRFDISWSTQVRVDIAKKKELVEKMRKAGCIIFYVGFESPNQRSLDAMNKKQTVREMENAIKVFHNKGILVYGMFVVGFDTDERSIFKEQYGFCLDNKIDFAQFLILTPIPGSKVYKQFEEEGRLLHKIWDFYGGLHTVYEPAKMSAYELQDGLIKLYQNFYSNSHAGSSLPDAIKAATRAAFIKGESLSIKVKHLPYYFLPVYMRYKAKDIMKQWLDQNQVYLQYLKGEKDLCDTISRRV